MKFIFIFLVFLSTPSFAERYVEFHDDPNMEINVKNNFSENVLVTWTYAKNVKEECNKENRKRKIAEFNYAVEACAFYGTRLGVRVCHIITKKDTTLITTGHEFLHCFQGAWHKDFK